MEHAIQGLFAGIAVAVLLYPVYMWCRDWKQYNEHINQGRERCRKDHS